MTVVTTKSPRSSGQLPSGTASSSGVVPTIQTQRMTDEHAWFSIYGALQSVFTRAGVMRWNLSMLTGLVMEGWADPHLVQSQRSYNANSGSNKNTDFVRMPRTLSSPRVCRSNIFHPWSFYYCNGVSFRILCLRS